MARIAAEDADGGSGPEFFARQLIVFRLPQMDALGAKCRNLIGAVCAR